MYDHPESIQFFDGDFVKTDEIKVHALSQTLHYGFGVFEGLRSYETPDGPVIFKGIAHFERLVRSAEKLSLPLAYTPQELLDISYQLLKKNKLTDAYIRPLVFAGANMSLVNSSSSHLLIAAWKWGRLLGNQLVNVMTSSYHRPRPASVMVDAKVCGYYANSVFAMSEARSKGFHDAIMLDIDGYVIGATGTNIFVEKDEVLYTPPKEQVIPGITRATIMEMADKMGIKVVEIEITPQFVKEADGAFLVGTATEIAGIATMDQLPFLMAWEDTLGHMLSRKYLHMVTHSEYFPSTLI